MTRRCTSSSSPGIGKGDMAFEIEMLLAADAHLRLDAVLGIGHLGFRLAPLQRHRLVDDRCAIGESPVDIAPMGQVAIVDLGEPCCPASDFAWSRR